VRAALAGAAGVEQLWVVRRRHDQRIEALRALAAEHGVAVEATTRDALDALLPGVNHQGVAARCAGAAAGDDRALLLLLERLTRPALLLLLDGVTDPHNLGACLRTAEAAGADAVIAPRDRAVGLTATVSKVAAGAAERLPFIQVTNLARTLEQLARRGIWSVGLAGEAPESLHAIDLRGGLALVLGSEGRGLRRLTRERCDRLARIPMAGQAESLNVSVAAGVALFEAQRQRSAAGASPGAR
jgi:23S rRNA (guanosine2251-2'-O)-methyltransferase